MKEEKMENMNQIKKKNRNVSVDIIRIIALVTVLSVHFFHMQNIIVCL